LPGEVIGADSIEKVILSAGIAGPYERRGTLADWQSGVGAFAKDHLLLRFSIAVALTGPMLGIGGFESGIFHLFGRSSEGKTTCLRTGASLWGSGADGCYMRMWRATSNGLEAHLAGACDTFLPLDEIGQADGRDLGQGLYMATSGVGKSRMGRNISLRPSYKWRVSVLSSGEMPIESRLNEDLRRGRAHAGHLVRAIDIDARRELGVFDRPHAEFDSGVCVRELTQATSTYYGAAGPEFVRRLIERNIAVTEVRDRVAAFVAAALKDIKDYHGQAARAATRFGLVALAGELATELGIASWPSGVPTRDALELLEAWLDWRGGAAPYEAQQIVGQVRHFIEANGDSRFDDLDPPPKNPFTGAEIERRPVIDRAGWRRYSGAARRWYVPTEVWKREVCAGLNPTEVARVLAELGALEKGSDGKSSQSLRLLSGQKTQRVYVLTPAIFEGSEEGDETSCHTGHPSSQSKMERVEI
jgi:putative DNA primase/helicase